MGIKAGDMVSLTWDAVYYTGKVMPDWVKNDRWIVKSISGDRAVIDKNESGTRAICSPVHVAYLKVEKAATASQASAAATPQKTESQSQTVVSATAGSMTVSEVGVELVAKYEGCRLEAYKCPAGVWTYRRSKAGRHPAF